MKKRIAMFAYSGMQLALWGGYAVLVGFSSNFLKAYGFQDGDISLLLGLTGLAAIALQILSGAVIGRFRWLTLPKVSASLIGMMLVGCLGMLLLSERQVPSVAAFALSCLIIQIFPSLMNSIGVLAMQHGAAIQYDVARGLGSLGYSICSFLAGRFVSRFGVRTLSVMGIVLCALLLAALLCLSRRLPTDARGQKQTHREKLLKAHPRFAMFLLGCILLYFSHNLVANFMQQIMSYKGGGAEEQGIACSLAAILELPAMFSFSYLLRTAPCRRWMKYSCFFFVAKAVTILLAPNSTWIYLAQIFQMLGYAVFSIASVYYVSELFEESLTVSSQTYLAATITIGTQLGLSSGGFLCQHLGVNALLAIAAAAAALGAVIVSFAARKTA